VWGRKTDDIGSNPDLFIISEIHPEYWEDFGIGYKEIVADSRKTRRIRQETILSGTVVSETIYSDLYFSVAEVNISGQHRSRSSIGIRRLFGRLSPGLPSVQDIDHVAGFPKPVCHPSGHRWAHYLRWHFIAKVRNYCYGVPMDRTGRDFIRRSGRAQSGQSQSDGKNLI
jgi:hypothetical protein